MGMRWMRFLPTNAAGEVTSTGPWFQTAARDIDAARRECQGLREVVDSLPPGNDPPDNERRVTSENNRST